MPKRKNYDILRHENGTLEAVSYDANGREISRNALTTAGEETMLCAVPEKETVEKGHLCYIRLQYTDNNGTVKPTERGVLDVTVEGGKLIGLGSACPYYELSYLGTKADTYYGEAMAIVEAGSDSKVTVNVTDGTHSTVVEIPVR